jgi:hypothetical protein
MNGRGAVLSNLSPQGAMVSHHFSVLSLFSLFFIVFLASSAFISIVFS